MPLKFVYRTLLGLLIVAFPLSFIFNTTLFRFLNCDKHGTFFLDTFFLTLTSLADGFWVVLLILFFQSVLKNSSTRPLLILIFALILGNALLHSAKYFFDEPRPLRVLGESVCVLGQRLTVRSFPSGHSFSVALFFMHLRPKRSFALAFFLFCISFLAILSRAYVGAHFPRDMATGAAVGVLVYLTAEWIYKKINPIPLSPYKAKLSLAFAGIVVSLGYIFLYEEKTTELTFALTPLAYGFVAYWIFYLTKIIFDYKKNTAKT
ncbi:MAG TPA: phosphatase PAP2 family protein [Turneriella sp.]|nr:phosphatase PAP2 family protein [Turneriella sp.]